MPIAVTALGGEALERRGITNVQGLEGFSPNLQISPTPGNSTAAQIAIRGSVTANPALTWEPAVGIYVDGVYVGTTQGALFDLIDRDVCLEEGNFQKMRATSFKPRSRAMKGER